MAFEILIDRTAPSQVILTGYLSSTAETKPAGDSTVTTCNLAVNDPRNPNAPASFFKLNLWNGFGTSTEKYLVERRYVTVFGRETVMVGKTDNGEIRLYRDVQVDNLNWGPIAPERKATEPATEPAPEKPKRGKKAAPAPVVDEETRPF